MTEQSLNLGCYSSKRLRVGTVFEPVLLQQQETNDGAEFEPVLLHQQETK